MAILAIDTASSSLSAAIIDQGAIVGEFALNIGKHYSAALLPLVENLLDLSGLSLSQMEALAVTVGPGSFTGLRIGLATVKGWALALDLPVIPVGTLEALAFQAEEKGRLICPVLDARRDELYAALFRNGQRLMADTAVSPRLLAERLLAFNNEEVLFAGDGIAAHGQKLKAVLGEKMAVAKPQRQLFMASALACLAWDQFLAGRTVSAQELEPCYLRLSEPEEKKRAGGRP